MDKPITIAYEDFKNDVVDLVNNSDLPFFVVELVFQKYLSEIRTIVENQYKYDKEQYNHSLALQSEPVEEFTNDDVQDEQ